MWQMTFFEFVSVTFLWFISCSTCCFLWVPGSRQGHQAGLAAIPTWRSHVDNCPNVSTGSPQWYFLLGKDGKVIAIPKWMGKAKSPSITRDLLDWIPTNWKVNHHQYQLFYSGMTISIIGEDSICSSIADGWTWLKSWWVLPCSTVTFPFIKFRVSLWWWYLLGQSWHPPTSTICSYMFYFDLFCLFPFGKNLGSHFPIFCFKASGNAVVSQVGFTTVHGRYTKIDGAIKNQHTAARPHIERLIRWMVAKSCTTKRRVKTCWNPVNHGINMDKPC